MVSLNELFKAKQDEMIASVDVTLSHPVAKGDNTEAAWKKFFKNYLPSRYSCDSGFVVDSQGSISDQIDIIIYDNHFSPFILNKNGVLYIPAESVYAVFEVKPKLSKKNFDYASNKVKSVRGLVRTSAKVICNGALVEGRKPFDIIGGLLTIDNDWANNLEKQSVDADSNDFLNMGCCIKDKAWLMNKSLKKYIYNKNKENSLLSFFMLLLDELQRRGTVPAMDITSYFDGFK